MREDLHLPPGLEGNLWFYRDLGHVHTMHHHAELEFNLITRGAGHYLLANRKYQVRRGDLLWLFPAQEHLLIDRSPDFEMWIAVFKPKAIRRFATDPNAAVLKLPDPSGVYCRRLPREDLSFFEAILRDVAEAHDSPGLFNAGLGYALLDAWRRFEKAADVPTRDVHPAVEKAARLIRADSTTLSVDQLAHRAGLSPGRLSRLFKQQTGIALVDFRNRRRLNRFRELYGAGLRRTMMDAALEAGFGSYPQFHRVFKRAFGCSPSTYKRRESPS